MKGQRKINNKKNGKGGGGSKEERVWERDRDNDVMKPVIRFKFNISPSIFQWSPWRNRLARSAVNRKVGGSSPPGDDFFLFFFLHFFCFLNSRAKLSHLMFMLRNVLTELQ